MGWFEFPNRGITLLTKTVSWSRYFKRVANNQERPVAKRVIETVIFKLIDAADSAAFLEAAHAVTAYAQSCPGFVARRLSQAEDGRWIEHIEWADMTSAKAAAAGIGRAPGAAPFLRAIDGPSVVMLHSAVEVSVG